MKPERWRKVEALYNLAREREPADRSLFLNEACQGDEDLRREVESLLAGEQSAFTLLDHPAGDAASTAKRLPPGTQLGLYRIENVVKGAWG